MRLGSSIVRKYFLISLLGSVVPMVIVSALYDRYASALLEQITGERLTAQLSAVGNKLGSFFDGRTYQIETLSNYPTIPAFAATGIDPAGEASTLLRIEADMPDLYGILFFATDGGLVRVVAGQAASGPPYWSDQPFSVRDMPITTAGDIEIIGPAPPQGGQSGWFLVRQTLRNQHNGQSAGTIALHVRLASVTELLGGSSLAGIVQPVLKTPTGYFDALGVKVTPGRQIVAGPEFLPGWQPLLVIDPDQLLSPFVAARQGLYLAAIVAATVIIVLFARLASRLRHRVEPLTQGAEAVAAGRLDYRIAVEGDDEIGNVAKAFNVMATRLQDTMDRMLRVERLAVLGEFATGVAHEIRNPLATIKTSVQALARGEKDHERLELLNDMGAEIDRLARVMDDVLAFGRPHPPQTAALPMDDLLNRLLRLMTPLAAERSVTLSIHGDSRLIIQTDRDQIIQVMLNLVINAVQAAPVGSRVTVTARADGPAHALLQVEDQGGGIPAHILPRVTAPFFTTKPKGTGLGLAISRQLIELNGGALDIHSQAGHGTTVLVRLPLMGERA